MSNLELFVFFVVLFTLVATAFALGVDLGKFIAWKRQEELEDLRTRKLRNKA